MNDSCPAEFERIRAPLPQFDPPTIPTEARSSTAAVARPSPVQSPSIAHSPASSRLLVFARDCVEPALKPGQASFAIIRLVSPLLRRLLQPPPIEDVPEVPLCLHCDGFMTPSCAFRRIYWRDPHPTYFVLLFVCSTGSSTNCVLPLGLQTTSEKFCGGEEVMGSG